MNTEIETHLAVEAGLLASIRILRSTLQEMLDSVRALNKMQLEKPFPSYTKEEYHTALDARLAAMRRADKVLNP
jgi:hypothetical protein